MKIAVCLLTCDRAYYTARTLETFAACNQDRSRFVLLHADDASVNRDNVDLASAYGFRTVVQNTQRRGWLETRRALFRVASRSANWILLLENDIESLRAFPWRLFDFVSGHREIDCLRLYGRYKDRAKTDKCLETHKRMGHQPVEWRPFKHAPEKSQIGRIHWSAQPCVTRTQPLIRLHDTGFEPTGFTARVKKNVMAHIGVERTVLTPHEARVAC